MRRSAYHAPSAPRLTSYEWQTCVGICNPCSRTSYEWQMCVGTCKPCSRSMAVATWHEPRSAQLAQYG